MTPQDYINQEYSQLPHETRSWMIQAAMDYHQYWLEKFKENISRQYGIGEQGE